MKNKKINKIKDYTKPIKETEVDLKEILERKNIQNTVMKKIINQINKQNSKQ